jgi:hypothetical protein
MSKGQGLDHGNRFNHWALKGAFVAYMITAQGDSCYRWSN